MGTRFRKYIPKVKWPPRLPGDRSDGGIAGTERARGEAGVPVLSLLPRHSFWRCVIEVLEESKDLGRWLRKRRTCRHAFFRKSAGRDRWCPLGALVAGALV